MTDRKHHAATAALIASGLFLAAPFACAAQEAIIQEADPTSTAAASSVIDPVGLYQGIGNGPDVASQLLLAKDGRFQFQLIAGALDAWSQGTWSRADDGTITLNTAPRPKPPELKIQSMVKKAGAPITIHITTPRGRGVEGVGFVIGFDKGEAIEHYTQSDGWQSDPAEKRTPRWIALREPIYDIILERTPIPDGANDLRFTLTPNDIGVLDFKNATGHLREEDGEIFATFSMEEGRMSFVRLKPDTKEDTQAGQQEAKP